MQSTSPRACQARTWGTRHGVRGHGADAARTKGPLVPNRGPGLRHQARHRPALIGDRARRGLLGRSSPLGRPSGLEQTRPRDGHRGPIGQGRAGSPQSVRRRARRGRISVSVPCCPRRSVSRASNSSPTVFVCPLLLLLLLLFLLLLQSLSADARGQRRPRCRARLPPRKLARASPALRGRTRHTYARAHASR